MISFHEIDLWTETFLATVLTFSDGIDRGQMREKEKKSLDKQVQIWSLEIKTCLKGAEGNTFAIKLPAMWEDESWK